jgi:hypothetical protein
MNKNIFFDYLPIFLVSLFLCAGLIPQGIPFGHDITYELVRVAEYAHSLERFRVSCTMVGKS